MVLRRAAACLLYAAAAFLMLQMFDLPLPELGPRWRDWVPVAVLTLLLALLATSLMTSALPDAKERVQAARFCLWMLFTAYAALLLYVLFLSRRDDMLSDWDAYRRYGVNLRPFATVSRYVRALWRGAIPLTALANLLGNLVLFVPMGVLLPLLFRPMRRLLPFLGVMLALLLVVEALQLALRCGSCDVDDVILNLAGALAARLWLRLPPLRRLLDSGGCLPAP